MQLHCLKLTLRTAIVLCRQPCCKLTIKWAFLYFYMLRCCCFLLEKIHLSMHFLYPLNPSHGVAGGPGACPSSQLEKCFFFFCFVLKLGAISGLCTIVSFFNSIGLHLHMTVKCLKRIFSPYGNMRQQVLLYAEASWGSKNEAYWCTQSKGSLWNKISKCIPLPISTVWVVTEKTSRWNCLTSKQKDKKPNMTAKDLQKALTDAAVMVHHSKQTWFTK